MKNVSISERLATNRFLDQVQVHLQIIGTVPVVILVARMASPLCILGTGAVFCVDDAEASQ